MNSNTIALLLLFSSSFFFFFFTPSLADTPPLAPVTPTTACNSTPDPNFCKSVLPPRGVQNLYTYGRFSLAKSLLNAQKYLNLINRYLARPSTLSQTAIRALEDCQLLSQLNIDFLTSAGVTLNSTNNLLDPQADKLQTFLSALLTNQQTCLDGIQATASAWSVKNGLTVPLSNGTKLYGVSLALFTKAWVPKNKKTKFHHAFVPSRVPNSRLLRGRSLLFHEVEIGRDGSLPLKMSNPSRELFEGRTGRRLLQATDAVLVNDIVVVSQDGSGNFTTIGDAVDSAPDNLDGSSGYYLIYVDAGVYEEYVVISKKKKYLMMIGDGINQTVVTGNHSVVDGWTTFNSATLAVVGQAFVAINMTFQNTAGAIKHQAVAVRNGADLSTFYSCSFEGYQDTLYTHSMRQFYRECDIYGTVDYIFGNAAVVFQNCNIYSRLPMQGQSNTITAQGRTDPNQNTGTTVQDCNIRAAADLAADRGSTITYLGRPWKNYSRTVIMESFMDSSIDPRGWMPWDGDFALSTLYYAEFNNTGPGSDTSNRVTWPGLHVINSTDASNFTVSNFILGDNWLPQTGVPYSSGLL
ncbi:probable pectinesterase/pectinesterase inhibitor 41 [Phoenix dactylifera]|uniref:Pectinesterase n=1 Tax=Phoenix dactylifera TaxID=42345 RepID=A0A8B8ZM81_PHODC|nr:probable pectinesterase/pectinesterase inhibitor 41 [Phoenix dactylifera]